MRRILILFLALPVLLQALAPIARADEYTPRQRQVIDEIYAACDRYGVTDEQCALPLYVSWRESRYGTNIYGDYDPNDGYFNSVGSFQFYDHGLATYGEYYQQFGKAWREDLYMETDMGVRLLTSHMRGGPDFRGHWRAYTIGPWPGLPPRSE